MFQLKPSHDGVTLKFRFRTGGLSAFEDTEGKVHIHGGSYIVFSNSKFLNCGSPWNGTHPYPDYKYWYNFGGSGSISRNSLSEALVSVYLDEFPLLYKQDNQGGLFRRIYKKDGEMYFVGGIHKDPENCKKPSSVIIVMDNAHLKEKGWLPFKKDIPAEEKVRLQPKPKVPF